MLSTQTSITQDFKTEHHSDASIAGVSLAMIAVAMVVMNLIL